MTVFLEGKSCLRHILTSFLNGQSGVVCMDSDVAVHCGVCQQSLFAVVEEEEEEDEEEEDIQSGLHAEVEEVGHCNGLTPSRSSSSIRSPTTLSHRQLAKDGPIAAAMQEAQTRETARRYTQLVEQQDASVEAVYEERLAKWKLACISCSSYQKRFLLVGHFDCKATTPEMMDAIRTFKTAVRFAPYSACYHCGQPQFICPPQTSECRYPLLYFYTCLSALLFDPDKCNTIVRLLGGPEITGLDGINVPLLAAWVGKMKRFHGKQASQGVHLLTHWLDHLEAVCTT